VVGQWDEHAGERHAARVRAAINVAAVSLVEVERETAALIAHLQSRRRSP
jgi:hypothetical protein